MKTNGPWKIESSKVIYHDPWVELIKDEVIRPDGKPGTYCVVNIKAGVSVLAMDADENVYLTEEFHYAIRKDSIETVSGGIDSGESPLQAAKRELKEELGIVADQWTAVGTVDPFTSSLYSPTELFLAQGLTFGEPSPEGTELITLKKFPFHEALQMVMKSEITHAPSCVLILKVAMMTRKI